MKSRGATNASSGAALAGFYPPCLARLRPILGAVILNFLQLPVALYLPSSQQYLIPITKDCWMELELYLTAKILLN